MRYAENIPAVDWTDEEIKWWAGTRGLNKLEVAYVDLCYAVDPEQPDCAEIRYCDPGCPVRRFKRKPHGY